MQSLTDLENLAERREPTEEETFLLPAFLADDGGEYERIPLSNLQVEKLK